MPRELIRRFRVRHYELNCFGHVSHAVLVKYMQEAAIEASTEAGYSPAWYREHGTGWVIRRLQIRYDSPAGYGDEIAVRTWVSDVRRVTSHREYVLARASDGARLARARVNWVYLDFDKGQPLRIPGEFKEAFLPSGELEDIDIRLPNPKRPAGAYRYTSERRVQVYELDTVRHVHHAAYLSWIEQAHFDAVRAAGYPAGQVSDADWQVVASGHDIEYFEPALDNEEIEILSWLCETGETRAAWTHEIYNANTKKLLARDYSVWSFVDSEGKTMVPQPLAETATKGPAH